MGNCQENKPIYSDNGGKRNVFRTQTPVNNQGCTNNVPISSQPV